MKLSVYDIVTLLGVAGIVAVFVWGVISQSRASHHQLRERRAAAEDREARRKKELQRAEKKVADRHAKELERLKSFPLEPVVAVSGKKGSVIGIAVRGDFGRPKRMVVFPSQDVEAGKVYMARVEGTVFHPEKELNAHPGDVLPPEPRRRKKSGPPKDQEALPLAPAEEPAEA